LIHRESRWCGVPVTAAERNAGKLDSEIFISLKIFDRNSQVRFHQCMAATGRQKSPVHDFMHSQPLNHR